MKRIYLSASLLVALAGMASAQCKLDGRAMRMLDNYTELTAQTRGDVHTLSASNSGELISVAPFYVMLNDGYTVDDLTDAGYEVQLAGKQVAIVRVPLASLKELASLEAVRSISASNRVVALNDRSREATGANSVHDGSAEGLNGTAFTGKGVVTGIVDMGIDPNHINFIGDDGKSRVKEFYTWIGYNTPRQTEYKTPEEVAKATTGNSSADHGTHVLGTIAGGYKGPGIYNYMARDIRITDRYTAENPGPIPYYGYATGADIVASDIDLWDAYMVQGVKNAVDYAKSVDKPCVINMSLGVTYGPRDNSSSLNRLISELADDAIIVVASGNDGMYKTTIRGEFDANTTQIGTLVESDSGNIKYEGEFWSSDDTPFTLIPCIVDVTTGEVVGQYEFNQNTEGQVVYFNGTFYTGTRYNPCEAVDAAFSNRAFLEMRSNVDPSNNRYNVQIKTGLSRNNSANKNLYLGYIIKAPAGVRVYGYICSNNLGGGLENAYFTNKALDGWSDGMTDGTISNLACSDGTICVGSYCSRVRWGNLGGKAAQYTSVKDIKGEVSTFTSYGRINDGRVLPHLIAPGSAIISSTNRYYVDKNFGTDTGELAARVDKDGESYYYEGYCGTSMATPAVTGTIALMLEADPTLKTAEALDILTKTASADNLVSLDTTDPARYGAGLMNTAKAVAETIRRASVGSINEDPDRQFALTNDGRLYTAVVAGATVINATIYNIAGSAVAHATADGDSVTIDASGLSTGVYILRVNANGGSYARRIIIR